MTSQTKLYLNSLKKFALNHFLASKGANMTQTEGRPSDPKASSVSTHTCLIPNTAPESPTRTLYWPVSEKLNLRVCVLKRLKGSFEKQSKVSGERLPATSSSAFMIHGKKTGGYNNTQTLRKTCILKCCLKVH